MAGGAWARDRARPRLGRRHADELAFLPALLEITETPASPLGRGTALIVIALFAAMLTWACLGRVDIHATAQGRVIPVGRTKVVAPLESATVAAIEDRAGGFRADRPGLAACLDYLRPRDVLVVLDLDRLGRRARDLIVMIEDLEKQGIGFRALNTPMDTTTPAGRAFLQIQAAFAEMERNLIRQPAPPTIPGPRPQTGFHFERRRTRKGPTERRLFDVGSGIGGRFQGPPSNDWWPPRWAGTRPP